MCCELYNAALESWRGTYLWWREHHPGEPLPAELRVSRYDLMKEFTGVRSDNPRVGETGRPSGKGRFVSLRPRRAFLLQEMQERPEPWVSSVQVVPQVEDHRDT